eukprot:TRINITY_DN3176_c2_g2_i1.p1 TRINITY_DN3176_c2_g2~~TRINITY_DN3176_c2_g2_i1.p1  ORF type:complete len:308 (+),score=71.80 TRINITY_DN3176_c2_g2_i1:33-956(+)
MALQQDIRQFVIHDMFNENNECLLFDFMKPLELDDFFSDISNKLSYVIKLLTSQVSNLINIFGEFSIKKPFKVFCIGFGNVGRYVPIFLKRIGFPLENINIFVRKVEYYQNSFPEFLHNFRSINDLQYKTFESCEKPNVIVFAMPNVALKRLLPSIKNVLNENTLIISLLSKYSLDSLKILLNHEHILSPFVNFLRIENFDFSTSFDINSLVPLIINDKYPFYKTLITIANAAPLSLEDVFDSLGIPPELAEVFESSFEPIVSYQDVLTTAAMNKISTSLKFSEDSETVDAIFLMKYINHIKDLDIF